MKTSQELIIKVNLDAWHNHVKRASALIEGLSDEQLERTIAPKKNSGIYLVGHLIAVHDGIAPLLDKGQRAYPELENIFIKNSDKSGLTKPEITILRQQWKEVHKALEQLFLSIAPEEWLQKHTAVSQEDFAKEPHRNKLNIIVSRTNHLAYHLGQLALLKS